MAVQEIKLENLDPKKYIEEKVKEISDTVGDAVVVNALSGGVDSSALTMLAHRALGDKLKTYFIENGLMREGEPEHIVELFKGLGVNVELLDCKEQFFTEQVGRTDPEDKREGITRAFYPIVFADLVKKTKAKYVMHGTNYTDIEETVAGVKRQHNIIEQLGIDPQKEYGYQILEPLIQLRKSGVRTVAKELGLPEEIFNRPPFPGPALAARVIGEITEAKVEIVRKATKIVEEELCNSGAFQYLAILHEDKVTGVRDGKRDYGNQIEVRCWDSTDAVEATPTDLPFETLKKLGDRISTEVPGIVSVTYNITSKPPSTIEAV
jgi:GMP synthase (glutamine-hydrolysing)